MNQVGCELAPLSGILSPEPLRLVGYNTSHCTMEAHEWAERLLHAPIHSLYIMGMKLKVTVSLHEL